MPLSDVLYQEYRCSRNAPLRCDQSQQTAQECPGARFCLECGFPAHLSPDQEIKGQRGTYRVKQFLGARGYGRLYAGVQLHDNQPVVIKEYLLPAQSFTQEEIRRRQETFTTVAGLTPADGKMQDFRLVPIVEAIADGRSERCYLIMQEKAPLVTLGHYLATQGAMSPAQVRDVLSQVLQTLQFLHNQRFRRPSGHSDRGIAHANLSLESLLLVKDAAPFYIYLSDLADWEFLFRPAASQQGKPQPAEDLVALGQVAFYLWCGKTVDAAGQPLDPRQPQHWPNTAPGLKRFILRLLGIESPFETAEAARQALRQLSTHQPIAASAAAARATTPDRSRSKRWWWLLLVLPLLLLGGIGLRYLLGARSSMPASYAAFQQLQYKKLTDVNGVEPGEFRYSSEQEGTWDFILRQPIRGTTLGTILTQPKPDVEARFIHQAVRSGSDLQSIPVPGVPVQRVQQGQSEFAITSLVAGLPNDLESAQVAYDGLLVYVPFNKGQNLSRILRGQIRLEDLRRIYTGELQNWQQLGGPNLKIVARIPTEPEAVRRFQTLVLQDDPEAIDQFWQTVQPQSTSETLQQARNQFASGQAGIISFGILSKTWNQCGGYPLALVTSNGPVQALIRPNGQAITPDVNLCDKASRLDVSQFASGRYPLGYPVFVVYSKDNRRLAGRKFAEFLNETQEGQCLLDDVGLVPLQPTPDDCS